MSQLPSPPKHSDNESPKLSYLTFPTAPPRNCGRPLLSPTRSFIPESYPNSNSGEDWSGTSQSSDLPVRQLIILAMIALAEQTAFNSMSPYLPEMTLSFPEVNLQNRGLALGTLASSFAMAQFATSFFWGWLSDHIGRKPVAMLGIISTAACFLAFGFCKTLWQATLIQVLMGLVNGNQGIISTFVGEITDKNSQNRAFIYLPVIYGLGAITGPAVGGLMVLENNPFKKEQKNPYPYLLPNLFSTSILLIIFIIVLYFLKESLDTSGNLPPIKVRGTRILGRFWQLLRIICVSSYNRNLSSIGSKYRNYLEEETNNTADEVENTSLMSVTTFPNLPKSEVSSKHMGWKLFNRDTIILLATYLIFQLSNVSFNSLYPMFISEPTGRNISAENIGLSLSFSGLVATIFQITLFGKVKEKIGNRATYRACIFLLSLSMMIIPWVGYSDSPPLFGIGSGDVWFWIEIGFVLLIKTIATVGGLSSALLLVSTQRIVRSYFSLY